MNPAQLARIKKREVSTKIGAPYQATPTQDSGYPQQQQHQRSNSYGAQPRYDEQP